MPDGTTPTGLTPPTTTNPFGLTPSQQAWMQGLQGLGSSLQSQFGAPGGANFMRGNPGAVWSQGQQPTLLATLMQMRQNQALSMGTPYQAGVSPPRVSLLYG